MTSSNGNIFRVTGHLCGEFTGPGEFPAQRPVTRSFDVFFDLRLNKLAGDWRRHRGHYDVNVMETECISGPGLASIRYGFVVYSAPSHYLRDWWFIVNWLNGNNVQSNLNKNKDILIEEMSLKMSFAKCCSFRLSRIHRDVVTTYGDVDLGQDWHRQQLVA